MKTLLFPPAALLALALIPLSLRAEEKEKGKSAEAKEKVTIEAGKPAPDFSLKDESGKEVKLSSLRGKKNVLLAFYPKDFTSGCTSELKRFRDEHEVFIQSNVLVLGISTDGVDSHKKFCTELKLPFPLLADEGGKVSKQYGILMERPGQSLSGRSVFLVDKEGIVKHADSKYDLATDADHDALLKEVKALGGKEKGGGGEGGKEKGEDAGKKKTSAIEGSRSFPHVSSLAFGRIEVEGKEYTNDLVFEGKSVRERNKGPSKGERERYGHTPLTPREEIPWNCRKLIIGTGMEGRLPVTDELHAEARRRGVELILLKTPEAVERLRTATAEGTNVILHITC